MTLVKDSPLVSVIVPTRDRLSFLKDATESILSQSLSECEVIVVDDASTDGTAAWLASVASERLVTVRLDEHVERAVARNRGLERARGDFVIFLDDDDRFRHVALEKLHSALNGSAQAVGAVGARVLFNDQGQRRRLSHPRRSLERTVLLDLLAGWMSPPGSVLWRTSVVRAAGGWNEAVTLSGDRELFLRMSRYGPVVFIPEVVLEKRAHTDQWRAPDIRERKAEWMGEFVRSLPPDVRPRASSVMAANRLWNDARIAYGSLHAREAVSLYVQSMRVSPLILSSPLLRPVIVRGFAKSLLALFAGRGAMVWARRTKRRLLRRLGSDVDEAKHEMR
jgi:glycosyltransferase involved in cell wall biosynthesis